MIIEEKAKKLIDYCILYTHIVPPTINVDGYKVFDIDLENNYVQFYCFSDQEFCKCEIEFEIIINGKLELIKLNIAKTKGKENKTLYEIDSEILATGNKINLPEQVVDSYIEQFILDLDLNVKQHKLSDDIPEETIKKLNSLSNSNVRLLLHGTDIDSVDQILNTGLWVPDFGLSCRTTAMIENTTSVEDIIKYNYSIYSFMPINIIITIPSELFQVIPIKKFESNNGYRSMKKCRHCTCVCTDGYNGWCYSKNKWYEAIIKEIDGNWVIPKDFIYGYIDYQGNIYLNDGYLFIDDEVVKSYKCNIEENLKKLGYRKA